MSNVRFITWNMGDNSKSKQLWLSELTQKPEWASLFDPDTADVIVLSTQEDHRADSLPEALASSLLSGWNVHTSIVKGPLDVLKKPFTVKLFVFTRLNRDDYSVREAHVCFQKQLTFCSKGTAGIALNFADGNQLVLMGSHFPISPKEEDLGYQRRIKAINTSLRNVFDQLALTNRRNVVALWGGDMNFRRNTPVQGVVVEDQLSHALSALDSPFMEAELMFPPTCKFHACTKKDCPTCRSRSDEEFIEKCYDTHREPSHCDRILYYVEGESVDVTPKAYRSWVTAGTSVEISDHNMVYADFKIDFFSV